MSVSVRRPRAAQAQLERLGVQRVDVARARWRRRSATPSSRVAGRRDARARRPASRSPSARRSRTRGRGALAVGVERLDAGQQHLLDGALDRAHGEALLEDAVGLVLVEAREGAAQARRRGRARRRARGRSAIAEEMLWVSSKAARSASISARSNWRWPPAVRRGSGKPKRRSQERSVFGLTPSIAAAAFVRIAPMHDVSSVGEVCATMASERCSLGASLQAQETRGRTPTRRRTGGALGRPSASTMSARARRAARADARPEADAELARRGAGRRGASRPRPRAACTMRSTSASRAADLGVGGHEQVADVAVDDVGLARPEQLLGRAADRADRELAVDEQERILRRRRGVGRRGDEQARARSARRRATRAGCRPRRRRGRSGRRSGRWTGAVSAARKGDETWAFDHEAFT